MPAAKLALALLLAASIFRAFYGPPPAGARRGPARAAAAVGVAGYVAALVVAWAHHTMAARVLIAVAVEALCLAAWLARGRDDRGRGDEPEPEPDKPVDWARFDRERERWGDPTPV
jgi:hypothetical protein